MIQDVRAQQKCMNVCQKGYCSWKVHSKTIFQTSFSYQLHSRSAGHSFTSKAFSFLEGDTSSSVVPWALPGRDWFQGKVDDCSRPGGYYSISQLSTFNPSFNQLWYFNNMSKCWCRHVGLFLTLFLTIRNESIGFLFVECQAVLLPRPEVYDHTTRWSHYGAHWFSKGLTTIGCNVAWKLIYESFYQLDASTHVIRFKKFPGTKSWNHQVTFYPSPTPQIRVSMDCSSIGVGQFNALGATMRQHCSRRVGPVGGGWDNRSSKRSLGVATRIIFFFNKKAG